MLDFSRDKWFMYKEQTKLLNKQEVDWFGFTIYRNSESGQNHAKRIMFQKISKIKSIQRRILLLSVAK